MASRVCAFLEELGQGDEVARLGTREVVLEAGDEGVAPAGRAGGSEV